MAGIQTVGVVGAGLMGRQIALAHAAAGFPVRLFDADAARLDEALPWIDRELERGTGEPRRREPAMVRAAGSVADAADCDLVIESVVERAAVKRAVLAEVEAPQGAPGAG